MIPQACNPQLWDRRLQDAPLLLSDGERGIDSAPSDLNLTRRESMAFCLLFEATSIHEYLAAGNKLRQIVGASESIESLCGPTLDSTLSTLPHGAELAFSRRAGGVFVAFCDREAPLEDLARAWSLIVREKLPGLAFKLALGHGSTRLEATENARHQSEGTRPASARWLPSATPFSARQASTGLPAVVLKGDELLDAASRAKLDAAKTDTNALGSRFLPGSTWRDWPLDLSADSESELAFPFLHREQSLALLVADGNGLGQRLQHLHRRVAGSSDDAYLSTLRAFSDQLEGATRAAAQHAVAEVAVPARQAKQPNAPLPLRPVLLGGDDLVVIIRADLALPFARSFMAAFERETSARIPRLEGEPPLTAISSRLDSRIVRPIWLSPSCVGSRSSMPFRAESLSTKASMPLAPS